MKVMIDPGHGGKDRANKGPAGYIEADGVLDIALKLKQLLIPDFEVKLTRETDTTVFLANRAIMSNNWGSDLFISIHTNANGASAGGIESYCSLNGDYGNIYHAEAMRVASILQDELCRQTGLKNRGVKNRLVENTASTVYGKDYYAVIRKAKCPAIIIEAGFHTNPVEEALLKTEDFRMKIATAIKAGLVQAYEVPDGKEENNIESVTVIEAGTVFPAVRINGDTYVKLRPYAALDGKNIAWDEAAKTAAVSGGKLEEIKAILQK